ncbi:hypothetical protein RE628_15690 [Paenibacillus sp. D2_2]|nr:hypothetical protein [Paenibacillus sp. D2_2]WMT38968.1 hypothetical protein RE628_15690 [Paenibacillus sp. D2_2]
MAVKLKKILSPTIIFFASVIIVSIMVAVLSRPYFTEPIFNMNENKYKFASEQGNLVTYHSRTAAPIQVSIDDQGHTVTINHQEYYITKDNSPYNNKYDVIYPNGRKYEVQDQSGFLMSFDEKGDFVVEIFAYVNGHRVIQEGEDEFTPSMLVTASYPEYHYTRGIPGFLFLALALLIYGWCSYRYEKFQDIQFYLSPRRLWYNDPNLATFITLCVRLVGSSLWSLPSGSPLKHSETRNENTNVIQNLPSITYLTSFPSSHVRMNLRKVTTLLPSCNF